MYAIPFVLLFPSLMLCIVPVTFAELKTTLPSIYTLAWTTISERLLEKKVSKLSDLSKEDKASLAFLQIFGFVLFHRCLIQVVADRFVIVSDRDTPRSSSLPEPRLSPLSRRRSSSLARN